MLTLPIKKKWFDMILAGEKKEEYRALNQYYRRRLGHSLYKAMRVRFRNGYGAHRPTLECVVIPGLGPGCTKWGALPGKTYFVLHIQSVEEVAAGG